PESLAVGTPLGGPVGDRLPLGLRRDHPLLSRAAVPAPKIGPLDADFLKDPEFAVVGRPVLRAPPATLEREQQPGGRWVLRVDDVDVAIGTVAPRRVERHTVASVRPGAKPVLRATAVADQR